MIKGKAMEANTIEQTEIDKFIAVFGESILEFGNIITVNDDEYAEEEKGWEEPDEFCEEYENDAETVRAVEEEGITLLHSAVELDRIEVVKFLIEAGGDVNAKDKHGYTPLFEAKSIEVAKILIEAGAEINVRVGVFNPWRGEIVMYVTPLDFALEEIEEPPMDGKEVEMIKYIKYLLSVGARSGDVKNNQTQQEYAASVVEYLESGVKYFESIGAQSGSEAP